MGRDGLNTKSVGDRTEAIILAELLKHGLNVLLPFGDNQRYDLVVEQGGKFIRLQCKTGRLKAGAVVFSTASVHWHRGGGRRSYGGQVEYFAVYCADLDQVYMVPVAKAPTAVMHLRVEPSRNGQRRGVCLAASYEISSIMKMPL